jgi:hypothetical protein
MLGICPNLNRDLHFKLTLPNMIIDQVCRPRVAHDCLSKWRLEKRGKMTERTSLTLVLSLREVCLSDRAMKRSKQVSNIILVLKSSSNAIMTRMPLGVGIRLFGDIAHLPEQVDNALKRPGPNTFAALAIRWSWIGFAHHLTFLELI